MSTIRWVLHDPVASEDWTMPINPDSVSPVPLVARSLSFASGWRRDARPRTFVGKPEAGDFTWAGVIRTEEHYNELARWAEKPNAITVTDHIGRTFTVFITAFEPTDRRPTRRTDWRLRYTMKTKLLEGPA